MAGGIKGITVEIGGDVTPLNKALKGVNQTSRELQSELREVNKALKLDPNNVTLTAQKQQLLKDQIAATKEKLDSLKTAQKQVKDLYKSGQIDDGQYRAFQRELELTKSKLSSLQAEKKSVSVIGAVFGTVKDKIAEAASTLAPFEHGIRTAAKAAGQISGAGIKTVSSAVSAAGDGLKVYTAAATAAGGAIVGLTAKAAGTADDINTLSAQTGLSTDQIQKFQYAADRIDVPLETLTGSMAKLTRSMSGTGDANSKASEAFSALGVSVRNSNGELRDNQDVFNDAIAALGQMENSTQRDAYAMQIFGKSAQDLNPLILGGAETLKELGDQAEASGLILSQDALGKLNSFQDGLDTMKASAGQAGNVLAGTFAGALTSLVGVVNEALPKITGSIAGLFSGQNMEASQKKLTTDLVSAAKQIVSGFASQLPTYLNGFNAVIISIVAAIVATLPVAVDSILPALIAGFTGLIEGLMPQVPILLPIILGAAVTLFTGLLDGLNQIIPQMMGMLPTMIEDISGTLIQNLPLIITAGIRLLTSLITGITNSIPQLITAVIALIPVITKALLDNLPALIKAGIQLIVALATGLPQAIPEIIAALPQIIGAIIDGLLSVDWLDIGIQIIKGIGQGLIDGVLQIGSMIKKAAGNLLDKIKDSLGIHSPSVLFRDEVGKFLALGVGEGFVDTMKNVSRDMQAAIPLSWDTGVRVRTAMAAAGGGTAAPQQAEYAGFAKSIVNGLAAVMGRTPQGGGVCQINVVLPDGTNLASVVYDPLKKIAKQKGDK